MRAGSPRRADNISIPRRSEEHTSELQSRQYLVCRLLLEKKKKISHNYILDSSSLSSQKLALNHERRLRRTTFLSNTLTTNLWYDMKDVNVAADNCCECHP